MHLHQINFYNNILSIYISIYFPGSKTIKAAALSCMYPADSKPSSNKCHLIQTLFYHCYRLGYQPPNCPGYLQDQPAPAQCSQDNSYVPSVFMMLCSCFNYHWSHNCHLTHQCLTTNYWWETVIEDTESFVNSCLVCAQDKVPHTFLADKFFPLPVCNTHGSISY